MPSAAAGPRPDLGPPPPTGPRSPIPPPVPPAAALRRFGALVYAGFRRHATYRQATLAAVFTNLVFGAMLAAVLAAVTGDGDARPGGYGRDQLLTLVWAGQGLFGVVYLGYWKEVADRVASGAITADLLRPVDPLTVYAAADLGRAAHAALTRFPPMIAAGLAFYAMYVPRRVSTYPLFAASVLLAVLLSFTGRYLVNLSAFWLLDVRGPQALWLLSAGPLSGFAFPLRFLPDWAQWLLWLGTPFPGIFQIPLDIVVERAATTVAVATVALQALWAMVMLLTCAAVQRRALRRLVVQGG